MNWVRSLIVPVVAALMAASAANGAFWQWSQTATSNATADPTINWSEGMSPSSVNDSARAMMARLAQYRDDISGKLVTTGTASAYTLTSNQGIDASPIEGQMLTFTPHVTNNALATLRVDGGNVYSLQTAIGTNLEAGQLVAGVPYTVKWTTTGPVWILHGVYGNQSQVPLGAMIPYLGASAPNANFLFPIGQCISRTTYDTFFALVSTQFGACDGVTTFALVDMRGRAVAGLDNMGGSTAGRLTATYYGNNPLIMGTSGGAESITLGQSNLPAATLNTTISDPGHSHTYGSYAASANSPAGAGNSYPITAVGTSTGSTTTGISASTQLGGSDTPFSRVQPTTVVNYIVRVR